MPSLKITLAELASLTGSKLIGDPKYIITGVADLKAATPSQVSFLGNSRYESAMRSSSAGAIFVSAGVALVEGRNYLITDSPTSAFQKAIETFSDGKGDEQDLLESGFKGIHPTAIIHPSAVLGKNVTIGPYSVIERNASVGDDTTISSGCHIGVGVSIGQGCLIHPQVVIREMASLGNRVIIQPGAVVGACGFGYTQDKQGHHYKLKHVGTVALEDDVEIGANTVVEKARFQVTRIGQGTKIGHLIVIGHNSVIGRHNIIVSQTGIAGSTEIANHCILAAQVGVAGHLKIGDRVIIGARGGVSKSILEPGKYAGEPVVELKEHNRTKVYLRNIAEYVDQIRHLKARLEALENVTTCI